jgi:uncharacterized membrane protein
MAAQPSKRALLGIRALTAVSAASCAYLLVTALRGSSAAGCGPGGGCEDVLASGWAHWFGLPVSMPALLLHITIFLATFGIGSGAPPSIRRTAQTFLSAAAWIALSAAAWFILLQLFAVRRLCPYCLVTHLAGATAALLILRGRPRISPVIVGSAALGLVVLLAGQWMNRPAGHEVRAGSGSTLVASTQRHPRQLAIFGGLFKIDIDEVPLIGQRDAPAVMVALLDYTCRHCRQMHGLLLETERAHRGRLAIATLPMPLDSSCNKVIPRTAPPHVEACQYARLGLAVWRADPSKMERFNDWVFEPPSPPGLESVLGYAMEIVGDEKLGMAMNDPWIARQIEQSVAIYEATYRRFGKGVMPQLIVGDNIVFGELEHGRPDLEMLLRDILK